MMIVGLEIMIGRVPAILGWVYALLNSAVDISLLNIVILPVLIFHWSSGKTKLFIA